MNFILSVIAVVTGLYLFDFLKDISYEMKIGRRNKKLLRWKKECEANISTGKEVEKYKNALKAVEVSLAEMHENYNSRHYR